jgi:hypothetical protein
MGDLRPLGSEKLEGVDKLKRIMEIARYNEAPKSEINPLSTTNYSITLADGMTYGIVKEKSGYIIKKGLNESEMDYNEPMRQRKYFRSYSEAMKKLNLVAAEVNRVTGNDFEIPLIGEQEAKKKYVLKTPKPKAEEIPAPEPPAELPAETTPTPEPPASEAPLAGDEMGMGSPEGMGADMGMDEPEGMEPEGMEPDMGMGEPEGMEPESGGEETEGPVGLKSIQRLTGKLSQKIRAFDKDQGLDSQDIKYVINSILSAMDLENLDEDDKDDILSKFDEESEYGMGDEGDLDISGEDEFDMGEPEGMEPEMGMGEPEGMEPEMGMSEPTESYMFKESVESVLSNYFVIKEEEKEGLEKKSKKNYLRSKINKIDTAREIRNLSESNIQYKTGFNLIEKNVGYRFVGKTNKSNLVFIKEGKEFKVTPTGSII